MYLPSTDKFLQITSIYQSNQKLKSIRQAELNRVDLNELMQLTHRISRTNAVAAPLTWKQVGSIMTTYSVAVGML